MEHHERVEGYFAAYAQRDRDAMAHYFDDGIVWLLAGAHDISGDYEGRTAALDYLGRAQNLAEGSLTLIQIEVLEGADPSQSRGVAALRRSIEACMAGDVAEFLAQYDDDAVHRQGKSLDDTGTRAFRLNDAEKFAESWLMYTKPGRVRRVLQLT